MNISSEYYTTHDLSLAAFLSLNFELEAVDKKDSKKCIFLFPRSYELEEAVDTFWRGQAQVEAREYFNQLRFIKSRLYANN